MSNNASQATACQNCGNDFGVDDYAQSKSNAEYCVYCMDNVILSQPGTVIELLNTKTNSRRELAIPSGLTWNEALAYIAPYQGADEIPSNTFVYR